MGCGRLLATPRGLAGGPNRPAEGAPSRTNRPPTVVVSTPTLIGASGVRSFIDDTLPSGSVGVTYEITATRSTKRGLPAQFNVNFGVGGDGAVFASVETVRPMKMAA